MENLCEEAFYQFVEMFDDIKEKHRKSKSDFQDAMEILYKGFFFQFSNLESWEIDIINRWTAKLRYTAGEWYDENVQKKREEENRRLKEKKEREEREEREREREREQREKNQVQDLNEKLRINDDRIYGNVRKAIESRSVDQLTIILNSFEEEFEKIEEDISELPDSYQDDFDVWIKKLEGYKKDVKNQISILEEETRIAKRKVQEEQNRRQLEQLHAQFRNGKSPQPASSVPNKTNNLKGNEHLTCPNCGQPVGENAKFCKSCGTKLGSVCPTCGSSIKPTAKFCSNCGTKLTQTL